MSTLGLEMEYKRLNVRISNDEEILDSEVAVEIASGVIRLLAPNPSIYTGKGTNTYLISDDNSTLVIDPGPADKGHISNIIEISPNQIKAIAVTHTHIDHWPGTPLLKELTGASTYGYGKKDGFEPDFELSDFQKLEVNSRLLTCLYTPGHASNHICYLLEDSDLLFTGDHLMNGATVIIPPPDGDMGDYIRSLRRLLEEFENIKTIAPGHGRLINDPKTEIKKVIEHRLARENKVIDALKLKDSQTIDELLGYVYSDVSEQLYPLAKSSLFAHLRKLYDESVVTGITDAGKVIKDDPHAKWKLI